MKKIVSVLVATVLLLAGTLCAQQTNSPPPAPPPAPSLSKDQMELLRQKMEELKRKHSVTNAPAVATNTPAGRAPAPMIPLPSRTPPAPTIPAAQTPAAPAAPTAPPAIQPPRPTAQAPAPPVPGAPTIPAGQLAPGVAAPGGLARKPEDEPFKLNFQNAPNDTWLDLYAELVGRTILRASNLPETKITIKTRGDLTREEAILAFEHVLTLNNLTAIRIGEKFVEIVPSTQAVQEGAAFSSKTAAELPEAAQFVTQIIQLKHVAPSEAQQAIVPFAKNPNGIVAIDGSQTLVLRDYAINVKRMMEVIEKIDVAMPLEVELELIPIKYALVSDIAAVLGSLTSGGAVAAPTSSTGSRRTGSTTGRRGTSGRTGISTSVGGQPGMGTQPGQPGYNPLQRTGTTTPGSPSTASGAVSSFQDRLRSIVSRAASGGDAPLLGDAKIIPDERTNSLLVFATKQEREMIKNIIEKLDVVQSQVLIEALILDVRLDDSFDYGVSMSQNRNRAGEFSSSVGSSTGTGFLRPSGITSLTNFAKGFSYFGTIKDSFDFVLTAIATDDRVNVLSRPRIQTSHAVEAEIFSGETRPIPSGTYYGLSSTPSTQINQQQIGIRLTVLPLINQDGLVVMDIAQTVQDVSPTSVTIEGNDYPIITDREATSRVAVKDKETIILGGFIRTKKTNNRSGVPGLKDIPLLGKLFSSKKELTERSELIVLIRPTVLPTPEVAALTAQEEREKMIGIKAAEAELKAAQRKQDERFTKEISKEKESKTAIPTPSPAPAQPQLQSPPKDQPAPK